VGFAFISPAWISIVPEVVSKQDLASAVTLGGLQLNICGIVGPAMGALLLSHFGPPVVFGLNSLCFVGVLAALLLWRRGAVQSKLPLENFFESFTGAIRYVRYAPGIQVVLARNALFSLFISAIPALLPVVGLKEVKMNSSDLGLLFTSMGIGSVFSGIILIPRARSRFSPNTLTILASLLLVAVFIMMALVRQTEFFMAVSAMAGAAWTMAAAELWVAGQRAMPPWARGRMNATHIMVSQGAMALGALVWGASAVSLGPSFALALAAALLLASLLLALPLSIDFAEKMNFDPGKLTNRYHAALQQPQPDDGPVSITIEFRIDPSNRAKFLKIMREVRLMHLRNGAYSWRLDEDLTDPNVFRLEMLVASWSEHLLQHERTTKNEQSFLEQAWLLDTQEGGPVVKHHLSVNKEVLGGKRIEIPSGAVRHSELQFRDA
ncbi:MAG: MFS transporter, partial [Verrucomicrobia bacterium]|nr:MFS transporter [Verrucomicrobiota bacterium]